MPDILKSIKDELPPVVTDATFEGANIVLYTDDKTIRLDPDKKYIVNCGSVGQPRDSDPRACYCVYDTDKNTVEIKRIPYDTETAAKKISDRGLPIFLAERLKTGI